MNLSFIVSFSGFFFTEGKFEVKVTAINPLGNLTEYLASPFYVQKPPRNLYFCQPEVSNLGVKQYAGHVGQDIKMCANVTMGTNVTFDWKLGDQNDMVKHGGFECLLFNYSVFNPLLFRFILEVSEKAFESNMGKDRKAGHKYKNKIFVW